MNRREFLSAGTAGFWLARRPLLAEPTRVHYRQPPPYEPYVPLIEPGHDEFPEEKAAMELEAALKAWWHRQGSLAEARFYALPANLVRFEFKETGRYRTGLVTSALRMDELPG